MISFDVPGTPVGKARARSAMVNGRKLHFTPEKTVNYEATVRMAAAAAMDGRPLIEGPVEMHLAIFNPVPKSWSLKKKKLADAGSIRPTTKPDTSNVLKSIEDAMNQVVYGDDTQIVDHHIRKRYAPSGMGASVSETIIKVEGVDGP